MKKTADTHFIDWENSVLGYGYGTGEPHTIYALHTFFKLTTGAHGNYDYEALEKSLGETTAWLVINLLCHANIVEYGTSTRYGWLTKAGKNLRSYILSKSLDELCAILSTQNDLYSPCFKDLCQCEPEDLANQGQCSNPFWER